MRNIKTLLRLLPVLLHHAGFVMMRRMPAAGGSDPGPSVGDGYLMENGTDFIVMEDGSFYLLE